MLFRIVLSYSTNYYFLLPLIWNRNVIGMSYILTVYCVVASYSYPFRSGAVFKIFFFVCTGFMWDLINSYPFRDGACVPCIENAEF